MITAPWPHDGELHLYCRVLSHLPLELARWGSLLSTGETGRAGLLKSEQAKRNYIAGRGLLRAILGGYLGSDARDVQLETGPHGKPFLTGDAQHLCFNLSHSGDHFLLAVAAHREVGIDIEMIDPGRPLEAMARMVFSRNEQDTLSGLSSPLREAAFYRGWVRKEACLKACGRGFSLPGTSLDLSPFNEAAAMIARCDQRYWHLLDIDVPHPYCAAVAVEACCPDQHPPKVVLMAQHPSSEYSVA